MQRMYFLKPESSVNQKCLEYIENMLARSTTADIAVAYFTHIGIAKSIISRSEAQLPTRIILNKHDIIRPDGNNSEIKISKALYEIFQHIDETQSNKIQLRFLGRHPISQYSVFHHKFILTDDIIGFGSLNFTYAAFRSHYENFVATDSKVIRTNFRVAFEDLWKEAETLSTSGGSIRAFTCPNCHTPNVDFESYGAHCINCNHIFYFTGE